MLRLPHSVAPLFEGWLDAHFPDRKAKVLNRIRQLRGGKLYDSRFGMRGKGEGRFAEQISEMFEVSCRRADLKTRLPALSAAAFRLPTRRRQLDLFGRDS